MDEEKPRILIIDDERIYLDVLVGLLSKDYRVSVAKSGAQALKRIQTTSALPDLILLDVVMPEMDGYEVCQWLKADGRTAKIPVIFLTVKSEVEDEIRGFRVGAVDYITKPVSPPIVQSRVKTHLTLVKAQQILENQNAILEERVRTQTAELLKTQDAAITCIASLAETRDPETGHHIRRTQHYVRILAEALRDHPRYREFLTDEMIELLFKSAPLHDIGKVGVPDQILLKPGKLEEAEWRTMQEHVIYGHEVLLRAERELRKTRCCSFLRVAREMALSHHEHWDGTGYPRGLKGEAIPISARLMALADVYDALVSRRVYKEPMSHEAAVAEILKQRGAHFDPAVVDAFQRSQDAFLQILHRFSDEGASTAQDSDSINSA